MSSHRSGTAVPLSERSSGYSRLETGQPASISRSATCPGQCAHDNHRTANCRSLRDPHAQGSDPTSSSRRERMVPTLMTRSRSSNSGQCPIGCKNLRDCLREVPRNWRSFDVQPVRLVERARTHRTQADSPRVDNLRDHHVVDVVDTRCLRDTEGSASRHLGTNVINMRGMCHNANMKGLIKDIWTCIEDLLREAYKHAQPGKRVDVALGFVCNSGRHRSVCISEMTTAVLARMGICTRC